MKRIGAFTLLHQMEKVAAPERKVKEILQFFGKIGKTTPQGGGTMDEGKLKGEIKGVRLHPQVVLFYN